MLRVVNDRTDDLATTQIVGLVSPDFHFEVVETCGDGFLGESSDFFIRVTWSYKGLTHIQIRFVWTHQAIRQR